MLSIHLRALQIMVYRRLLYLDDPDGNGVELYWDRPKEQWPYDAGGSLQMGTYQLDLKGLLAELEA